MMLNSLDLRSSASVKSNRASNKGQKLMVLHSCIVVNSRNHYCQREEEEDDDDDDGDAEGEES